MPNRPQADAALTDLPFERYTVQDSLHRTIGFYLSRAPKSATGKLPVVLLIRGSGCQSLFQKIGDQIGGGYQYVLLQAAKGRARVLAVEKPGVTFLDAARQPGTAEGASEEFLKEQTLPRPRCAGRRTAGAREGCHRRTYRRGESRLQYARHAERLPGRTARCFRACAGLVSGGQPGVSERDAESGSAAEWAFTVSWQSDRRLQASRNPA